MDFRIDTFDELRRKYVEYRWDYQQPTFSPSVFCILVLGEYRTAMEHDFFRVRAAPSLDAYVSVDQYGVNRDPLVSIRMASISKLSQEQQQRSNNTYVSVCSPNTVPIVARNRHCFAEI